MSFWKPAAAAAAEHDGVREDNNDGNNDESSAAAVAPMNFSRAPLAQQRMLLPIYKHRRQILYAVEQYGIVVIVGETGSGYVQYVARDIVSTVYVYLLAIHCHQSFISWSFV